MTPFNQFQGIFGGGAEKPALVFEPASTGPSRYRKPGHLPVFGLKVVEEHLRDVVPEHPASAPAGDNSRQAGRARG